MKVKDCMTPNACCVKPETKISDIAKLMSEQHIGCVPVCDTNNCIYGIITDRDILLRTVACNKDTNKIVASDIMSCNVCTCSQDEDVYDAECTMCDNQVRRLPVCDENNHVVGILTIGDLVNNDTELGEENVCETISGICNCNTHKNDQ